LAGALRKGGVIVKAGISIIVFAIGILSLMALYPYTSLAQGLSEVPNEDAEVPLFFPYRDEAERPVFDFMINAHINMDRSEIISFIRKEALQCPIDLLSNISCNFGKTQDGINNNNNNIIVFEFNGNKLKTIGIEQKYDPDLTDYFKSLHQYIFSICTLKYGPLIYSSPANKYTGGQKAEWHINDGSMRSIDIASSVSTDSFVFLLLDAPVYKAVSLPEGSVMKPFGSNQKDLGNLKNYKVENLQSCISATSKSQLTFENIPVNRARFIYCDDYLFIITFPIKNKATFVKILTSKYGPPSSSGYASDSWRYYGWSINVSNEQVLVLENEGSEKYKDRF
jgi:hypothetical protein